MDQKKLDKQAQHWDSTYLNRPEMFGLSPSYAAIKAAEIFKKKNIKNILELGSGQGRDTIFFAQNGFNIFTLDYSQSGLNNIIKKTNSLNLDKFIFSKCHDVRKPLPFKNLTFDGCFSHMLYCMAFTTKELLSLSKELHRVLKPNSINIYTARSTEDADYKSGIHRGEDLYECGGFIVHFFSKEKVKKLSSGFEILNTENFKEGKLPRKLMLVILKKN